MSEQSEQSDATTPQALTGIAAILATLQQRANVDEANAKLKAELLRRKQGTSTFMYRTRAPDKDPLQEPDDVRFRRIMGMSTAWSR